MTSLTIEHVLRGRGAWLKGSKGDGKGAMERAALTRSIAARYAAFEVLRDALVRADEPSRWENLQSLATRLEAADLLEMLRLADFLSSNGEGHYELNTRARRYLTGGWLEELAWLAAMSAGADEALFGQVIGWEVKGYAGENEIDLIMRRGDSLSFVSCKALRSELDINDKKHRNRLMDAVHEADNLADHFGQQGEKVAVLVTTDLYDEIRNTPRYHALMGKAAVLDVRVIALEELHWDKLLDAFQSIMPSLT